MRAYLAYFGRASIIDKGLVIRFIASLFSNTDKIEIICTGLASSSQWGKVDEYSRYKVCGDLSGPKNDSH